RILALALQSRISERILALALQSRISEVFAVDIHPAARIGRGILMDHGTGVVIGETAIVGDRVSLLQGVTLGGTGKEAGDRHPKVQEDVLIGAGATVLGNISIGQGSMIAAGSLVLKDVPPHSLTSSYGGLRLSAAPRSAVARGSRPPRATPLRGSSASASSSDRGASAGDGAPLRQNALTNFSPLTTGVATGKAAQCVPVDLRLAVLLGGFAFEAYSTPEQGSDKLSDKDGQGCKARFTSTPFAHELFQGQLSVRALKATGNIMARHAELALVTSAGKPATWNGVACTSKAENLTNPSWPEQLQLLVPRASPSDTLLQINLHYWNADNDDDDTNDYVVGTATIALTDLIKGSNTQIPEVVGLTLTHDGKKTGSVSMEWLVGLTPTHDGKTTGSVSMEVCVWEGGASGVASVRAEEQPGRGPRRRGDRWSPQCGRESAPHSPGPTSPPLRTCSRRDRGRDPAGGHSRPALRHSAGPAVPRNQPNVDARETARGDPNPSDAQATPSPASPEIAAESVARGIALGVSAGLPDHEGMGGEESEDMHGSADPPPRADSARDAQEKGGEERAAEEADVEASARDHPAADLPDGSTQHVPAPTNTPARWGARQADGVVFAPARSGGRARSRRGAQGDADGAREAQAPAARFPRNPPAPDPVSRMDPSPPIVPQPTPARRRSERETVAAPQTGREGAAVGRATRGIRVGRGSRRGRRGNERGRRGGGTRGSNRRRTGASGYARNAERLMRNGAEGGEEPPSEEAEEEVENEESDEGDPAFNPEREGMLGAEAEDDEEELELLLRGEELPNPNVRGEPVNRTTAQNRAAGGNHARGGNRAATETGVDSATANENAAAPIPTPPMLKPDDLAKNTDLFAQVANWDIGLLRDSRQPPVARHPPKDLRESFAICLLTPLLHLAANPESEPGWLLLTFLPRLLLRSSSARKPDWSAMMNRLLRFRQGLWAGLYEEAAESISLPPQPRHAPDTTGILARAEGLAKRGNLSKSLQSLQATPVSPASPEVLEALRTRHPLATQPLPDWLHAATAENPPAIEARDLRRIIAKLPNGVGAGPSGTTFEHLRDAALGNAEVFTHLLALTNTALAGKLPAVAGELLTASRLLAFTKPHGGTRPIAVGECLLRIIAKAALFLIAPAARSHFVPLQFGVAVAGGIEAAIQIDLANAFNAVERSAVFEGIHPCLVATAAARPHVVLLAYADDITLLGDASACAAAFDHLTAALASLGLLHNPAKCAAWSAAPIDPASVPPGITISTEGLQILGSPVGTTQGCAAAVRDRLTAAAQPLPLLAQMDPQLCLLLLTRCVSRRASFLARTTPLEVLPTAEWSAWGERLLHAFLEAAHIVAPRSNAERRRIWRQAALPVTLGGLGITDPAVEGTYAYLASVVGAAHLLHSLADSLHPAIAALLPLMDSAPDSAAALPSRLAAAEAALPPDGLEALQADSESGTWSAWGLSPREWGEVQSALRAETPSASQESGQQISAAQRSRGPDGGCGTEPSPHARADICAASARAEEQPGRGPRRRGDRWSPQCGRESAPHSPGRASPPPRTCSRRDRGQDPAGCHSRLALRHSAGPAVPRNQPNVDAGGTARGDPNPSDAQATPSPASPEIAAESVARGIALGVSAGLLDHEGMGGEESEDVQGSADPPPRADSARDAQEKGGEERAAEVADVEASARAHAAADRPGGSTQHVQAPTNTPARWGARQADGEVFAPARSGGRARLRRGAQGDADEARQAQAPAARSPRNPPAPDPVSRMGPSPPIVPQPTPARRRSENETVAAPQTGREGAAVGRATRGIRVGRGSRRGRRANERGRRGGGTRGSNRRRTGASGYARNAERLMRNGAEGGEEPLSEEAEEEVENEESDEGDPAFNPEREGMLGAEAEEDEEELELLLRGEELPSPNVRGEPANRTTAQNRAAGGNHARRRNRAATETGVDSATANENAAAPIPTPPMLKPDDLAKNTDLFAQVADWDIGPLRDSRQPPVARHPPKDLRESFAICLLTPLLHLAANPESEHGWMLLTFLPRLLLRSSSARKPDWSAMMNRLLRFRQGLWAGLYEEAAESISLPPQPRHAPDTTGILARAEGLAKRGNLSKLLQSLQATPVSPASPEVLEALRTRHPPASQPLPDWLHAATAENPPAIEARDFRRIIAKLPNGVGAGPSGTTFEHLRDAALGNAEVFTHLLALTNTALAGKLPAVAGELFTASRLLAFTKPHGGTRPIAVGECLLRIIAKAALFLIAPTARSHFVPLQFGVAVAGGIEAAIHTAPAHPQVVLLAYADDITLLGDASACAAAFDHLTAALASMGLLHNPAKCAAWSAAPIDPASVPPGITISTEGLQILGSPVGTTQGCAAAVRDRLTAAAELLPLLAQMDPQLCLLLTRCVSRRASFLARTTPLEVLPTAEWSAWGEGLLHAFLEAAHIVAPRSNAERRRIWRQAALPVTLGGLGITDPAVEGSYAYLASVVGAAHLLHSLADSLHPAIAALLPLMDSAPDSAAALPSRLAAAEAALPPDGLEALQAANTRTIRERGDVRVRDGRVRVRGGRLRDGRVRSGRVRDGRVKDGRVRDGKMGDGRMRDGRMRDGRVRDGRVRDGRVMDGRVRDGKVMDGPFSQHPSSHFRLFTGSLSLFPPTQACVLLSLSHAILPHIFEPLPILQKLIDAPLPKSATVPQAGSKAVDEAAAYGLTLTDQQAVETLFSSGADAVKLAAWENLSRAAAGEQQEFFKSAFECVCFLSGDRTDTQVFVWRDKDPLRKRLVVAFRGTEFVSETSFDNGQVGTGQVGTGQVGTGQVGTGQVGSGQVGSGQVGTEEMGDWRTEEMGNSTCGN
ncbi:unnamed protein product, partial [Closterium sp. Naga37s-1]